MFMFMFMQYVLLLTSLLSSVLALPLVSRDVVDPPITSPKAGTVWHVGEKQTVTWSTTGLPVNQTNPVGMLVLGYMFNNSENLMLNSPLATNLNYSVGQAQITVPNVPTRTDYIVVLFGDSGNASPEFTIINDASSSASMTSSPAPTTPPSPNPPSPTTPSSAPSTPNPNSDSSGNSYPSPGNGSSTTATSQTASHTSTLVVVTSSGAPSPTQSSAAWQNHVPKFGASLSVALAIISFAFS